MVLYLCPVLSILINLTVSFHIFHISGLIADKLRGKTVLEVGSGTGAVGICAASLGG